MFLIKRIICGLLLIFAAVMTGCENADTENGYVESGELLVMEDSSDITLGAYNVDTLNPIATKSEGVVNVVNIIYDSLFTLDEEQRPVPELAQDYELSEDGKRISITLRDDVKWHDGTAFTANDVVFTLSKLVRTSGGMYSGISSKIASFTATEKNKVMIEFYEPHANPAYMLTFPIIFGNGTYSEDESFNPVGTGAYKLASKNGTELILEPNSLWHGGEPSRKRIKVKLLKDKDAACEAFNVGEIDAITSDEINTETVAPKMTSVSETMISQSMVFLGFNSMSEKMSSASVRSAISGFLDKEKILETVAYGQGMIAELAINPTSWIYKKIEKRELSDNYSEMLLTGDGYVVSDGVYQKNGEALTLRLLVNEENDRRRALADSIAAALSGAGVGVKVECVPYSEYSARIAADDFDMFVGETVIDGTPNPAQMLEMGDNYFNLDIAQISESVSKLYGVKDMDATASCITEISRRFYAEMPYTPLYFKAESVIYGAYVSGTEKPTVFDPYKGIEKWYFYDKDGKESKKGDE